MKTRRFDFNFKPLQLNIAISVSGSVPDVQNYNGDADEFTPDYTITPLILQPLVSRLDKDEIVSPGNINDQLTNIKWYQIINSTRTQILAANTDYEMTTSGGQAGRIKVKKNAQPEIPITLEFYAEYVDARTNQVIVIHATHIVKCGNATAFIPNLVLDAADQTIYNPLIDPDSQTVHASLRVGTAECATANRQFVWEVLRSNGTWTTAGSDNSDYWLSVAQDGASCTVNRKQMGDEEIIRCRAKYDPDGNPGSVSLTDAAPCAVVVFRRRLPKYEYDIAGVPVNIPPGLLVLYPEVSIVDVNGPVENPQNVLLPVWYIGTNRASGTPASYAVVAHGFAPAISTAAMSQQYGAVIGVEVKDPGPLVPWKDYDGSVFKDADGAVLLIK